MSKKAEITLFTENNTKMREWSLKKLSKLVNQSEKQMKKHDSRAPQWGRLMAYSLSIIHQFQKDLELEVLIIRLEDIEGKLK